MLAWMRRDVTPAWFSRMLRSEGGVAHRIAKGPVGSIRPAGCRKILQPDEAKEPALRNLMFSRVWPAARKSEFIQFPTVPDEGLPDAGRHDRL